MRSQRLQANGCTGDLYVEQARPRKTNVTRSLSHLEPICKCEHIWAMKPGDGDRQDTEGHWSTCGKGAEPSP